MSFNKKKVDNIGSALPENVHAYTKQYHVNNARNNYPFPKIVAADKFVRLSVSLYSKYNVFEQ